MLFRSHGCRFSVKLIVKILRRDNAADLFEKLRTLDEPGEKQSLGLPDPVLLYVWCDVNFVYTMSVCNATTSARLRGSEESPGYWNLKCQASCALDHLHVPNNVLYYHLSMHMFNFDGTQ